MQMTQKITPCLWFDDQAEPAAHFYTSVFPDSCILETSYYGDAGPRPADMVMTVDFVIAGQRFTALNGGPEFTFDEAISFQIPCEDQAEIDRYWEALTADGGEEGQCGWCKDRFGVSWQVFPARLPELLQDPDKERAGRAMKAMMDMSRIDIRAIEMAADGALAP